MKAGLWSFFLKQGGYHGFDGNEPGLLFLHFFCKSWSTFNIFFLNMAGFTDFIETEQRRNVWACFVVPLIQIANCKLLLLKIDCNFNFAQKVSKDCFYLFASLDNTTKRASNG